MSAPLRLGIVGCGDIAGYTAWLVQLNRGVRLAACCDRDLEKAQRFARRHRIPLACQDYAQLLGEQPLEAVYLAVPHHLHAPMIRQAVARNVAVWVEKPLTRTLAEGIEVTRLAEAQGVKVGVNYQYRYDRACYALAQAVRSGALGEVYYARANLPWQRQPAYFEQANWHARLETAGGGTLLTQGSHLLDIALWALNSPPRSASGYLARRRFKDVEVEDLAMGEIELESGALAQISSAMVANPEAALSLEIYGARGSLAYTDRPWPRLIARGLRPPRSRPPGSGWHALQRSLEGFRRWLVTGESYLIPARAALPALAAVEALYAAAGSGQRTPVDLPADLWPGEA